VAAILDALADQPRHGYAIMDELESRSEGSWRPSPGSIYPALDRLTEKGLIEPIDDTDPKEFEITADGREWLAERGARVGRPWDGHSGGSSLRGALGELTGAARQIERFGSDDQRDRARSLIEGTTRGIYSLLAEESPTE